MKLLVSCLFGSILLLSPVFAMADDKSELTALLSEFLDGATRNDASIHNKFWADELIYTSSSGSLLVKQS